MAGVERLDTAVGEVDGDGNGPILEPGPVETGGVEGALARHVHGGGRGRWG